MMATPTPVETSPPPAEDAAEPQVQPVLRVTAETTSRSPRQKDPKKVAAGRAGAAARKAKSERLERELAAAKESLRDPTYAAPVAPPAAHSNEEAPRSDKEEEKAAGSMSPWGVGVLVAAAGGLAYWAASRRLAPRACRTSAKGEKASGPVSRQACSAIEGYPRPSSYGVTMSVIEQTAVNSLYHAALVSGLVIGYAKISQMVFKGPLPKLDLTARDAGMLFGCVGLSIITKDQLIKRNIIPSNLM